MTTALINNERANDPDAVRLVQDGRILLGAYGIAAPTGPSWDPTADLAALIRTDLGYYGEDGFSLTPEPGAAKNFMAHNEDVVIDETGPGTWALVFNPLQQKKEIVETYFDTTVDATTGKIEVSSAAVRTYRDLVTVGISGDDELILTHYPRVKVASREALVYGPGAINSYGMTFRAYKCPILGYHFAQWSTFLVEAAGAVPTITAVLPAIGQAPAGNVVITGTGFTTVSGAAGVTFEGINASSYVVDSDTQITAVIMPEGVAAAEADIMVTNDTGASLEFEYVFE